MRKGLFTLLMVFSGLFLGGCSLSNRKSAIEINSYPVAKVYIDGKEMGLTPYRNRTLSPGEIEVKLVTNDQTWTKKVKLQNNISTVIDWEFGDSEETSGGYILYLEKTGDKKNAGLMVNTSPNKCTVTIDNEVKGLSPIRIADIGEGDRHLTLSFPEHKSLDVYMKSLNEYQLVVDATLAEDKVEVAQETIEEENPDLVSTPATIQIKILETETGWLRVRESSSSAAREVARVNPGETYPMLGESTDWYKIDLGDNKNGWISSSYGEKSE